jgi:hypothetical protein
MPSGKGFVFWTYAFAHGFIQHCIHTYAFWSSELDSEGKADFTSLSSKADTVLFLFQISLSGQITAAFICMQENRQDAPGLVSTKRY